LSPKLEQGQDITNKKVNYHQKSLTYGYNCANSKMKRISGGLRDLYH